MLSGLPARERRILLWMCVLVAVNQLGFGSVVPVLPLYARQFGVPVAWVGAAIGAYGLARLMVDNPPAAIDALLLPGGILVTLLVCLTLAGEKARDRFAG